MDLRRYLDSQEIPVATFATMLGITEQAVHRYLNGRVPRPDVMRRIIAITAGSVTPNDFYTPRRRAA